MRGKHTPGPGKYEAKLSGSENHKRIIAALKSVKGIPTESLAPGSVAKLVEAAQIASGAADTSVRFGVPVYPGLSEILRAALVPFASKPILTVLGLPRRALVKISVDNRLCLII